MIPQEAYYVVRNLNQTRRVCGGEPLKIELKDKRIFEAVPYTAVFDYLDAHGWTRLEGIHGKYLAIYRYPEPDDSGLEMSMAVPGDMGEGLPCDYASALCYALESVAGLERRDILDVLENVLIIATRVKK